MFDDKVREEYKSIKAPEELYEKIMNAEPAVNKTAQVIPFRKILAAAAALAITVISAFVLTGRNSMPVVYMGTEKLTGEIALTEVENNGIMLARMSNEISCEMTLELKKDTTVFLKQGILLSASGEVLLAQGENTVFSDTVRCNWTVPAADTSSVYEMEISDKNGTYLITLYFDIQTDSWTVCMTE